MQMLPGITWGERLLDISGVGLALLGGPGVPVAAVLLMPFDPVVMAVRRVGGVGVPEVLPGGRGRC